MHYCPSNDRFIDYRLSFSKHFQNRVYHLQRNWLVRITPQHTIPLVKTLPLHSALGVLDGIIFKNYLNFFVSLNLETARHIGGNHTFSGLFMKRFDSSNLHLYSFH